MSKKNKSKFKKQIKSQLLQELEAQETSAPKDKVLNTKVSISQPAAAIAIENEEYNIAEIKHDLKKTLIIVVSIAIIIGALYYLDLKYNILINSGNFLFRILNIN